MPYNRVPDTDLAVGKAIKSATGTKLRDNQDYFNGIITSVGSIDVPNGGFSQVDPDDATSPLNWTLTTYPGGTAEVDDSLSLIEDKILKFIHPSGAGNGGGYAISDFLPVTQARDYILGCQYYSTVASNVKVEIKVEYFDLDQVTISTETALTGTTQPTGAINFTQALTIPATAKYMKIGLYGGVNDTDPGVSATIYFDDVKLYQPWPVVAGDIILANSEATVTTASTSYVEVTSQIYVPRSGRVRITFDYSVDNATGQAFAKIYKNGSPVGTERSVTGTTAWQTAAAENFAVDSGDYFSIYAKEFSGGFNARVRQFRIKSNTMIFPVII